jgi:hypothetical protein
LETILGKMAAVNSAFRPDRLGVGRGASRGPPNYDFGLRLRTGVGAISTKMGRRRYVGDALNDEGARPAHFL